MKCKRYSITASAICDVDRSPLMITVTVSQVRLSLRNLAALVIFDVVEILSLCAQSDKISTTSKMTRAARFRSERRTCETVTVIISGDLSTSQIAEAVIEYLLHFMSLPQVCLIASTSISILIAG